MTINVCLGGATDAGSSARPYVDGGLLATRKVGTLVGVHRGLDAVLDL